MVTKLKFQEWSNGGQISGNVYSIEYVWCLFEGDTSMLFAFLLYSQRSYSNFLTKRKKNMYFIFLYPVQKQEKYVNDV